MSGLSDKLINTVSNFLKADRLLNRKLFFIVSVGITLFAFQNFVPLNPELQRPDVVEAPTVRSSLSAYSSSLNMARRLQAEARQHDARQSASTPK